MPESLAQALVAAQADMPAVEADAVNPHFKSKFVSLDHLIAKTRPVLNKHGLAIMQSPSHIDGQPALTTTIHHLSGESVSATMPLLVAKEDMQGMGAALTYARRYAWAAALGICADEDDDGNQSSRPVAGASAGTPAPAAENNGSSDEFRFTSGAHKGKTLAEVPKGYVEWCIANHPKPDVRELAAVFLGFVPAEGIVDDIPFDKTINEMGY